jgi:hypothetical protein
VVSMATSGASRRAGRRGSKATAVSLFTIRYSVSAISIGENLPLTVEYQISIADRLRQSALQTPSRPIGAATNIARAGSPCRSHHREFRRAHRPAPARTWRFRR